MNRHLPLLFSIIICMIVPASCKKEETATEEPEQAVEEAAKPFIISKLSATPQQKAVSFDHNAHKRKAAASGKNCKTCHHKGSVTRKCSAQGCHSGPGAEKLVHKKCYGECHLTAAAPKQSQCALCHRQ